MKALNEIEGLARLDILERLKRPTLVSTPYIGVGDLQLMMMYL